MKSKLRKRKERLICREEPSGRGKPWTAGGSGPGTGGQARLGWKLVRSQLGDVHPAIFFNCQDHILVNVYVPAVANAEAQRLGGFTDNRAPQGHAQIASG